MLRTHNNRDGVKIDSDRVTLHYGEMEPIAIPRRTLRTRLQLLEWIYRLSGWPGMNLQRMRTFIAAVFQHHGWELPANDVPLPSTDNEEQNTGSDSLGRLPHHRSNEQITQFQK